MPGTDRSVGIPSAVPRHFWRAPTYNYIWGPPGNICPSAAIRAAGVRLLTTYKCGTVASARRHAPDNT